MTKLNQRTNVLQVLIDTRSVELFFRLLGLLVAVTFFERLINFELLYSEKGVLPAAALPIILGPLPVTLPTTDGFWFLLMIGGLGSGLGMLLAPPSARLSMLCFVMLVAVYMRNPLASYGADQILRLQLLLATILLAVQSFSVRESDWRRYVRVAAEVAVFVQLAAIYLLTVYDRDLDSWWSRASAVREALAIEGYRSAAGGFLLMHPWLPEIGSKTALLLEALCPAILTLSLFSKRARVFGILIFCVFHLSIGIFMGLWFFACTMIAFWLLLAPSESWLGRLVCGLSPTRQRCLTKPVSEYLAGSVAAVLLVISVFCSPLLPPQEGNSFFKSASWIGIHQSWRLFSPYPSHVHGSLRLEAIAQASAAGISPNEKLEDPSEPPWWKVSTTVRHYRFQEWLVEIGKELLPILWGQAMCHRITERLGARRRPLGEVTVVFERWETLPTGEVRGPVRQVLARVVCTPHTLNSK